MAKFIAEVSSNHARDLQRCLNFIDASADIGCYAVKFQLFKLRELFSTEALIFKPSLLDREAWELPVEFLPELAKRCRQRQIAFCCTPFYLDAVTELEPFVDFYKIASYELLWDDLLINCAKTAKPIVLSTGMATLEEIQHATKVLNQHGCTDLTLLHCTSAYPTPYNQANLAAIETLRKATGCKVGWSDHTTEPGVIHRAIHHFDASVIEFHLDLDGQGDEFATGHCWLPDQMAKIITDVNRALMADGDGVKSPVEAELADRAWRADPIDGLRPLKSTRITLTPPNEKQ